MHLHIIEIIASHLQIKDLVNLIYLYREIRHDQSFWRVLIKKRYARSVEGEEDLFVTFIELSKFAQGSISLRANFTFDSVMDVRQSYKTLHSLLCQTMLEFDIEHGLDALCGKVVHRGDNFYYFNYHLYPKFHMTREEASAKVMSYVQNIKLPKEFVGALLS